jgi:predicted ester cyclase
MPPAGKALAVIETHWFRTRNGMIIEHWANRDMLPCSRRVLTLTWLG